MATVAGNSTVVSKHSLAITKSKWSRTAKVLAETEAAQQEAALLANELRDPGPSNDFVGKNKKGNGSARIGKRITRAIIHNYQNKERNTTTRQRITWPDSHSTDVQYEKC